MNADGVVQFVWGSMVCYATIENLGEGGLCMQTRHVLPLGAEVRLFVPVPKPDTTPTPDELADEALRRAAHARRLWLLEGRVTWRGPDRLGLQFLDPPPECRSEIRALVDSD